MFDYSQLLQPFLSARFWALRAADGSALQEHEVERNAIATTMCCYKKVIADDVP
jgi:hypothetical protein